MIMMRRDGGPPGAGQPRARAAANLKAAATRDSDACHWRPRPGTPRPRAGLMESRPWRVTVPGSDCGGFN